MAQNDGAAIARALTYLAFYLYYWLAAVCSTTSNNELPERIKKTMQIGVRIEYMVKHSKHHTLNYAKKSIKYVNIRKSSHVIHSLSLSSAGTIATSLYVLCDIHYGSLFSYRLLENNKYLHKAHVERIWWHSSPKTNKCLSINFNVFALSTQTPKHAHTHTHTNTSS